MFYLLSLWDLQRSTPFSENEETCQEPPFRPALAGRARYATSLTMIIFLGMTTLLKELNKTFHPYLDLVID